ncbi:hypothetical protein SAMN04487906_2330 [Zhouia amylolytica]|uniref:SpoIIAA-like n=1 Tax=Zhouia amylolytica TaxID=376730 RepID=A0A1I6U2I2_9FLAO|nr:hypothetical protein [Zhouia amylolytica]SFS95663.1 hypothetical protein SAMN04487906_2330 [Zhouia amylolytica]
MNEKYKYYYDPNTRILYRAHYGNISIEDIFESWNLAIKNNLIPKDVNGFILDYRDANLNVNLADHKKIIAYFDTREDQFGGKKFAVLVDTPKNTVVPFVIEHTPKHYILKTFNTEEAAIDWMLNNEYP